MSSLDWDLDTFQSSLSKASEIVVRLYRGLDQARITPFKPRSEIAALFDEPLPDESQAIDAILGEVEHNIFANSTLYQSPRFFGYINAGGTQVSVLAELLASAINQICAKWQFSPAASEIERRVITWLAEFIGYAPGAAGCLVSGGSAGNLVGLALSRRHRAPFDDAALGMRGGPPVTVYVSREGHASIEKAMVLLGMGRDQLRTVATRDDFTIDLGALETQVAKDRAEGYHPICVVGNGGTTNTGAVDPLDALADFCQRQGLWFHVDGAYGGLAARTTAAGALFKGLDRADSVVVDPHKWLYQPVEVSCVLARDPSALRDTFAIAADYLGDGPMDFKDYGPQLSRSFRALKVWMTFKAYGARALRAAIDSNIEIMRYLADRIDASPDFVRLAPVPLSVVCFQHRAGDVSVGMLVREGQVFVSETKIGGRKALRACSVNHRVRREDVDFLLDAIRRTHPGGRRASS